MNNSAADTAAAERVSLINMPGTIAASNSGNSSATGRTNARGKTRKFCTTPGNSLHAVSLASAARREHQCNQQCQGFGEHHVQFALLPGHGEKLGTKPMLSSSLRTLPGEML